MREERHLRKMKERRQDKVGKDHSLDLTLERRREGSRNETV